LKFLNPLKLSSPKYIEHCVILLLFLLYTVTATSQNLFANPGFEAINNCVEFKADCSPEAWFNIPAGNFLVNGRKAPVPVLGNMVLIVPVGSVLQNFNKPRFVYTGLCCPLIGGEKYVLSFYINTAGAKFENLAFYFTGKEPTLSSVNGLLKKPSLIITEENFDADYKKWKHVRCEFLATGEEHFCTITTLGLPPIEYQMGDAMNRSGDILYFIDEIQLKPEGPVPQCATYEATVKTLFDYNYRHTNNAPVFKQDSVRKPVVKFSSDTIIISDLLFDVGKHDLKTGVKNILDSLVAQLAIKKFLKMEINGHTDNSGNEKNNQILSEARATAIKDYLVNKIPAAAEKITAAGKGQNFPIAENSTAAGKQKNRRVEIVITYLVIDNGRQTTDH
jgi:outer membrane protein OmpA-like peptidoglycan-associated protein